MKRRDFMSLVPLGAIFVACSGSSTGNRTIPLPSPATAGPGGRSRSDCHHRG